jgi:radical SAM superfamily enzyme YgiQ (UPF0313 family)
MKNAHHNLPEPRKVLLIYPQCPDSFWSFKHALKFISRKAAVAPLGLITASALLPETWQKKLVDMNISELDEKEIAWADFVFISAMYIQRESVNKIISSCIKHGTKIVAGGPLFTQDYDDYPQVDHFVLNEAEITLPLFLKDLSSGNAERIYKTEDFADLCLSPVPDYHLLKINKYASMSIQISRGCPFGCEFCEITSLLGHKVRMKYTSQVIRELETLYHLNWRGAISIVDDNFIGNKKVIKTDLLPSLKKWMEEKDYPFTFTIQSSINLADDKELLSSMVETGFTSAFIGIETPDEKALLTSNKVQNQKRDLLRCVQEIQQAGMLVSGGFIVGFDSDSPGVFERQIDFIQNSGIVTAMVGLLNAPKHTPLYRRLEEENRLTIDATGNNTDSSMNFRPIMEYNDLINGYNNIIFSIYATKPYYKRVKQLLSNYKRRYTKHKKHKKISIALLAGFFRSVYLFGIVSEGRLEYWKLIAWTLLYRPAMFMDAIIYAVYGYHFRIVYSLKP